MNYKYYIATTQCTAVISGATWFVDGDVLYVYDGEELAGMFRLEEIHIAYRSPEKK